MENRFYEKSKKEQRKILTFIGLSALFVNVILFLVIIWLEHSMLPLGLFFLAMSLSVIAPFFDVPNMVRSGKLKYYSLFLLAEKERNGIIKLHGGTLFDYYYTLPEKFNGQQRTRLILSEMLKGLLNLTHEKDENIRIRVTSYILSERTAHKIGLQPIQTSFIQTLILTFNSINIAFSLYLSTKKWQWPKINRIRSFEGTIADIKANKSRINQLINKLNND